MMVFREPGVRGPYRKPVGRLCDIDDDRVGMSKAGPSRCVGLDSTEEVRRKSGCVLRGRTVVLGGHCEIIAVGTTR
jgi:hypothetical protein